MSQPLLSLEDTTDHRLAVTVLKGHTDIQTHEAQPLMDTQPEVERMFSRTNEPHRITQRWIITAQEETSTLTPENKERAVHTKETS